MRSHLANAVRLCLSLAALAGCSSPMMTPTDGGTDSGVPMPSMITATGTLTGTISAPQPTAGYDAVGDTGSFLLEKRGSGLPFTASVSIEFGGAPAMATYTSASAGFKCNVTVARGTAMNDTWVALFNSPAGANTGTCSLTLSSVTMSGAGYTVSGSFDVTAMAQGGASSGMVTLAGTF